MKLIFQEKSKVEDDAITFIFKPETKFTWRAGQYLFYTLPTKNPDNRGVTRYFTISSAPSEGHVAITTRIFDKPSTFKKSLLKLKPGDEIEASGPDGKFTVDDPKRNMIFISGGIGITPFRSILKEADINGQKLNVTLLYGNRNEDAVFKSELESFKINNPNLKIEYFISPDHIEESAIRSIVNSKSSIVNPLFYISGPAPLVRSIRDIVKSEGISMDNIKLDSFPGYDLT